MFNIKKMMEQAKIVQNKLEEIQEKIKDIYVKGTSGDGAVEVVMSCSSVTKSITIDQTLLNPTSKQKLEELLVAALNNANQVKEERVKEETRKIMASVGIDDNTKFPI